MRPRKYHVTLTEDERKYLNEMTRRGTASAQKIKHELPVSAVCKGASAAL